MKYLLIALFLVGCGGTEYKTEYVTEYVEIEPAEDVVEIRQVSLSFDDGVSLESVHASMYLFKLYNAKFTYYASHYWKIDKAKLMDLQINGYEVGHHGTLHRASIPYSNDTSMENWFKEDVLNTLGDMRAYGLNVTTYAYPFGSRSEETDNLLMSEFKRVRGFTADINIEYVPQNDDYLITAYSIDSHIVDLNKVYDAMDNIKDGETLFLATHVIGDHHNQWRINVGDLELILDYGDSTGITFCAVTDC